MKRKGVVLVLILLSLILFSSCTYEILDMDSPHSENVPVTPDDGRYVKAELDKVVSDGYPYRNTKAKDALLSLPHYFERFFKDGFMTEVMKKMGIALPDVSVRPGRAISAELNVNAENEVLNLGTPYHDWSEVYLDRLSIKASGNSQNLFGLILHHKDPMEWPKNIPFTGSMELGLQAGIRNGDDKLDENMPKAFISGRLKLEMENVIFDTVTINGNTYPIPVEGSIRIEHLDGSIASSHITTRTDSNASFPVIGEPGYKTSYSPFAISVHMEPTLKFSASEVSYAIRKLITDSESAESYWSYIINCCWENYKGNHMTVEAVTGKGNYDIRDSFEISDLLLLQMFLLNK